MSIDANVKQRCESTSSISGKTTPQVSLAMPSYQQAGFIEEAARSILDQEGVDVELIVMDPGSTDGSREILQRLKQLYGDRLVLCFEPDQGQSDAINRGLAMARGSIIGWLNSDDRLRPTALRKIIEHLSAAEPRWLYGRCGIIDDKGCPISSPIVWYKNLRGRHFSQYKLLTEDFIPQMSVFWNRSIWERCGSRVDPKRHLDMDYDLWFRFGRIAQPMVITDYLADFRVHPDAKSSQRTFEALDAAFETAREYAADMGIRGSVAILIHRLFRLRTKLVYRWLKP